ALIAESAFGRGGVAFGPTLNAVADAGGLQAMQKALDDINTGTEAQIALRAKLTTQFEENNKAAEKLITSIYSDNILSIADSLSEKTLAWAKALKSAADEAQRIAGSPIDYLISKAAPNFGTGAPSQPSATMPVPPLSLSSAEGFGKGAGDSPTAIANKYQALLGALGQAATPAQQLQGRFNELNKAIELNIIDAGQAARVQGILKESFAVDQLRAMVSALGAAATPAEQYRVTVASLHLELDKGQISQSTYNRAVANAAITYDQAINAGRERLGLLTTEEIGLANLQAIQDGVSKGFIRSSTDMTTAQLVLAKSLKDTNDRMEVLRSPLPGLTQATLDAGNFAKQLDTLTTTSLTNLGNGLTDILTQTVDLQTGIKNLEQQLIKSLVNMVVQMT